MNISDEAEMLMLGRSLAGQLRRGDLIALSGDLGAGKTVLARGILQGLGHQGEVASPSYALVHPYDPPAVRLPVSHVDLYRLDDPGALEELGLDEARLYGALIVEWPERADPRFVADALHIRIDRDGSAARRLTVDAARSWEGRWPPR
ncbi:MAG: tRNA (adenosine(37)-N6)-threonylcarbamoyltransferase complex ATPase subunit type 1 TsaE [Sphingorhabdus sp.]|nr:tRNA (adenosine(37)-N6)-threonylcarbamoyltransferase complex ATPase subunit type 1 TsaE [Sphingorhabdus sp.]|tara:strand:+ start:72 stop:515 length:444 start_codon:yes stop_codon:yes gene_type:complete